MSLSSSENDSLYISFLSIYQKNRTLVQPFIDPRGLPEDIVPKTVEESKAFDKAISIFGKTIGPTAPPANFIPLDFLAYLIDLKHQAQALGWIGGPKLVEELDKKLDQVKEKLLEGHIESAQGKLKSFIKKVQAHFKETKKREIEKIKGNKRELEDKNSSPPRGTACWCLMPNT
jgi:hypothetical protein